MAAGSARCALAYYSRSFSSSVTESSKRKMQESKHRLGAPVPKLQRLTRKAPEPWHVVVGVSLIGAFLALGSASSWAHNRRDLLDHLRQAGIDKSHPSALVRVEREGTAHHSRLLTARSLIYDSLARLWQQPDDADPEQVRQEILSRLPIARSLAESALDNEPGSWQAPMLIGASTYLERSLSRDRRLYTEAVSWEAPLSKATQRAAGHPEPRRLLATAYLETWFGLSEDKQGIAKDLLAQVFRDDLRAFEALLPAWLGLRLSPEETFSVVPENANAWRILAKGYEKQKRWSMFLTVHARYLDAVESQLEAQRQDAEQRVRLGDFFNGRSRYLQVIAGAPPSQRFAPLVNRVLEAYPPGLHGHSILGPLRAWLDWAVELGQLGRKPVPPAQLRQLIDAVGELERPKAALASSLAEDFYQAERFEKLAQPLAQEAWAPYLVDKARASLRRSDLATANEALAQVVGKYRRHPSYLLTEREAARASGDGTRLDIVEAAIAETAGMRWGSTQWRRTSTYVLEILPAQTASGFAFDVAKAPSGGAVIEVFLNGKAVITTPVYQGDTVRAPAVVPVNEAHRVEIRFVAGGTIHPGDLRLLAEN